MNNLLLLPGVLINTYMQGNRPVVFIDDDEDDQFFFKKAISELGITNKVYTFVNGAEALDFLQTTAEKPFLILCDINMPLLNGIELWNKIKQNEPLRLKCIPFIFFTTSASQEAIYQAYQGSAQGFYRKPNNYDQFKEQISVIVTYWQRCLHPNSLLD